LYITVFKGGYIYKKYYTKTSKLVPLLNCVLGVWDMYSRRLMQETPRKYNKQTYTKNDLVGDTGLEGNMMWRMA